MNMLNFSFSEKVLGLTKSHCLIAFTFRNIGQFVYYNCLLTKLQRRKI